MRTKYQTVKVPVKIETQKQFKKWAVGFTATVLRLITALWGLCMVYAAVIMTLALYRTGEFSYLDTYITKVCDCFMAAVVTGLITRVVGNVFQYNDGSIFGFSREENNNDSTDCNVSAGDMCSDDELNHRSG